MACTDHSDSDAFSYAPFCLAGSCVECINAGDCGTSQICTADQRCAGTLPTGTACDYCLDEVSGGELGSCPDGGHCSTYAYYICLADCTDDTDCRAGYLCYDADGNAVAERVPSCVSNTHCSNADASQCDIASGLCAPCDEDADCLHLRLHSCTSGSCVECANDPDCGSPYQICMGDFTCAEFDGDGTTECSPY